MNWIDAKRSSSELVRESAAKQGRLFEAHCDRVRACEDEGNGGLTKKDIRARSEARAIQYEPLGLNRSRFASSSYISLRYSPPFPSSSLRSNSVTVGFNRAVLRFAPDSTQYQFWLRHNILGFEQSSSLRCGLSILTPIAAILQTLAIFC